MRYFIPGYSSHDGMQYAAISCKNQKQPTNSLKKKQNNTPPPLDFVLV